MTCRQMGGPCDAVIEAATPEEMMSKGGQHITDMLAQGDTTHQEAKQMMDEAQQDPAKMEAWRNQFMQTYNSLPEEGESEAMPAEETPAV